MKVGGAAYGKREKLTADSLDHAERVAIRILNAGAFDRNGEGGALTYWISSTTPPDHILFLAGGDLRHMVERLGDETDRWLGQRVVLELVKRRYKGQTYQKYAIAPAAEWDDVLRPLNAPPSAKRTAKKTPRKPRKGTRK